MKLRRRKRTDPKLAFKAYGLGVLLSSALLGALLISMQKPGEPTPPALSQVRFSVAVMAGPKQAEQKAPENVESTAPATKVVLEDVPVPAVEADRETSLPDAVEAAQESSPGPEAATPEEVIPPAQVSMPGGKLMAEDAPVGDAPDPFSIGPKQVFIRVYVNEQGRVIRGGIVRSGSEPMRDALILRAISTRTYTTQNLIRVEGKEPMWQLDMVIDYGTNEFLP